MQPTEFPAPGLMNLFLRRFRLCLTGFICLAGLLALMVLAPQRCAGLTNGLALTPPMGWNSWNLFASAINEDLIRQMADAMATNGMKDAGYQWMGPNGTIVE